MRLAGLCHQLWKSTMALPAGVSAPRICRKSSSSWLAPRMSVSKQRMRSRDWTKGIRK